MSFWTRRSRRFHSDVLIYAYRRHRRRHRRRRRCRFCRRRAPFRVSARSSRHFCAISPTNQIARSYVGVAEHSDVPG